MALVERGFHTPETELQYSPDASLTSREAVLS